MKIGVTGATGNLGRLIIERLKTNVSADNVVALVRSPQKGADLGVEVRKADYDFPETLNEALEGIDRLLLISGSEVGKRIGQHGNVIEAAKNNQVKWIVYTSILRAGESGIDLAAEHRETEKMLRESGIPYTLLRNSWYTENYTGSIPGALAGGALIGSAGEGKISSATRADYADAAVAVLTEEGHEGKVYELAGDESYTLRDLANEISKQSEREIPYKNLTEADYAAALQEFGIPSHLAKAISGWDKAASRGELFDDRGELSRLIGRPTTPLKKAVADALEQISDKK